MMYFMISSRLMRAKMTCTLKASPRLHSALFRRKSLWPMLSPNTSTYRAFFNAIIRLGSPKCCLKTP